MRRYPERWQTKSKAPLQYGGSHFELGVILSAVSLDAHAQWPQRLKSDSYTSVPFYFYIFYFYDKTSKVSRLVPGGNSDIKFPKWASIVKSTSNFS